MNYWLAVGPPENWKTSFEQGNIWGLTKRQKHWWESLAKNDTVLLYVTKPVSGIIGYGAIQSKFRQTKPLWPQEIAEGKIIWPLCFEFDVEYCLAPDKWNTQRITSDTLKLKAGMGFHSIDPLFASKMISELKLLLPSKSEEEEEIPSLHEQIKQRLVDIGKLQGYVAETEYSVEIGKLDVVWRKLERSVPTRVFEVQVGGDIYHALAKLKHAFDLWNSNIFIIASQSDLNKVENLLSGTFHEIGDHLKSIELDKIQELYDRKRSYLDFEKELGIR